MNFSLDRVSQLWNNHNSEPAELPKQNYEGKTCTPWRGLKTKACRQDQYNNFYYKPKQTTIS